MRMSLFVKENVVRLQVPVNDPFGAQKVQCEAHLCADEADFLLAQGLVHTAVQVVPERTRVKRVSHLNR